VKRNTGMFLVVARVEMNAGKWFDILKKTGKIGEIHPLRKMNT